MIKKLLFPVLCFVAQLLHAQSDLSGIVTNYNLDMDECKVSRIDVRYHLYNQIGQTGVHLDVSWQTTGTDPDCLAGKTVYYFIKCHTQNPGDHYGELILNAGSGGTILKAGAGFGSDLSASPDYSQLFVSPETYNPSDPNTTLDQRLNNNGKSFQYLDQTMAQQYWKNGLVVDGIDVVINKNNTGMSVPTFNSNQNSNSSSNNNINTPTYTNTPVISSAANYNRPNTTTPLTPQQQMIQNQQRFTQKLEQQVQYNYQQQQQVGEATGQAVGELAGSIISIVDIAKRKAAENNARSVTTYPDGRIYDGTYKHFIPNGYGVMTYPLGLKYEGNWLGGYKSGQGIETYANGAKYNGNWKKGERSGKGSELCATGDLYEGDWDQDALNGMGTYTFANGNKYIGQFKNSMRNGYGTEYYTDGTQKSGNWVNDAFVASTGAVVTGGKNKLGATTDWAFANKPDTISLLRGYTITHADYTSLSHNDILNKMNLYLKELKDAILNPNSYYTINLTIENGALVSHGSNGVNCKMTIKDMGSFRNFSYAGQRYVMIECGSLENCASGYSGASSYMAIGYTTDNKAGETSTEILIDDLKAFQAAYMKSVGVKNINAITDNPNTITANSSKQEIVSWIVTTINNVIQKGNYKKDAYTESVSTKHSYFNPNINYDYSKNNFIIDVSHSDTTFLNNVFSQVSVEKTIETFAADRYKGISIEPRLNTDWANSGPQLIIELDCNCCTNWFDIISGATWGPGTPNHNRPNQTKASLYFGGNDPTLSDHLDRAFSRLKELVKAEGNALSTSEPVSPDYSSTGVKSSNKQTYTDGSSYEGDLVNNIRSGTGTNVWANGDKYTGEWVNGQITGKGVYTYSNGNIYDGYWKDGVCSGQGKFTITTGDVSIGNFGGGKLNGKGQYIFADGRKYDGMWKDGIKSGQGTFTWPNGDKYTGQWANDYMNGRGELNYADGRKYVGDYKNGLQDGYGKLSLANGENYTGQWKDNNANGPGAYTYLGGGKFEGNYKKGLRDGPGTFTYANGNNYSGNWVNDVEVGNSAANPTPVVPAKPIAHPDKMDEAVKPLVKKWRCVDIASTDTVFTNMGKEKLTQLKEAIKTITMDFKADYTFEAVKESGEKSAGTWELNTKEKKLITMDAGGKDEKLLISLTAEKLVIGLDANSSLVFAPYKNGQPTVNPSPATDGSLNPPCYIIGYSAVAAESIAKQYVTDLTQKGFTSGYMWVPDYEPGGKAIYRVYVGPFKTMQEANTALPGVKQIQAGAYIKLIDRQ